MQTESALNQISEVQDTTHNVALVDQGVQRRVVLVVISFEFLKLYLFDLLLLYVTWCMMWRLQFTSLNCKQHLEIFFEI